MTCPLDGKRCYKHFNRDPPDDDGLFHYCRHGHNNNGFCMAEELYDPTTNTFRKEASG